MAVVIGGGGGAGGGGVPITVNGAGTGYTYSTASNKTSSSIKLEGSESDIFIQGKSMKAWMEKVEERLNLLCVNPDLESDWEELREIGNQYRALEQRIKDKMTTWKKLQADDQSND